MASSMVSALPLVAGVLGKRYGVQVVIGGDKAFTDGRTIHLPDLPLEGDPRLTGLVRGYLDHESAHLRLTDFGVLSEPDITPLIKHVWNTLEDGRVEDRLSEMFPGCRSNFDWLVEDQFAGPRKGRGDVRMQVVNYILYWVRARAVPAVAYNRDFLATRIRKEHPALLKDLDGLLALAPGCRSSGDCMDLARRIVGLIAQHAKLPPKKPGEAKVKSDASGKSGSPQSAGPSSGDPDLQNLLSSGEGDLPKGMSESVGEALSAKSAKSPGKVSVAVEGVKQDLMPMPEDEMQAIRRATIAMRTRLHALLQGKVSRRSLPARSGKLDTHRLHKLSSGAGVFVRGESRRGMSTLVHVLLDCSGSMRNKMGMASQASYALACALHGVPGIRVAVTGFPCGAGCPHPYSVFPLLCPGQALHTNWSIKPRGNTPMGEALLWALREMLPEKETRKIILIVTDGRADSAEGTQSVAALGASMGFETYGVGIAHDYILSLLPGRSEVILNIGELPEVMFRILSRALVGC